VADKRALFTGLFDGTSNEVTFEGSGSFLSRVEKIVAPVPPAEEVTDLERDGDEVEAEIPLSPELEENAGDGGLLLAADPLPAPAEGAAVQAREDSTPAALSPTMAQAAVAVAGAAPASPRLDVEGIRQLVGQVRIQPKADGGITIDAPREAAATLGALLGELARMLSSSSQAQP
jgi:hypothetical protein